MPNNNQLKKALLANAAFSSINGILMIVLHQQIAQYMQIKLPEILIGIGIGLLLFAFLIFRTTRQSPMNAKQVRFITLQDWLWVIGSFIILVFQLFGLSTMGYILILVVAIFVGILAFLQGKYLASFEKLS